MKKYRIKNTQGRIFGPLFLNEIEELHNSVCLNHEYLVQIFPVGDWLPISTYPEIISFIESGENTDEVVKSANGEAEFVEFKYERNASELVDYTELKKKSDLKKEAQIEKTRMLQIKNKEEVEKTIVVSRLEDEISTDLDDGKSSNIETSAKNETNEKTEVLSYDDKTVIGMNYGLIKKNVEDVREIEEEINLSLIPVQKKQTKKIKQNTTKIEKPPKRKVSLYIVLFIVFSVLFMLPEGNEKKEQVLYPEIIFPLANKQLNEKIAVELYEKGLKEYSKDTYLGLVRSSLLFRKSIQNKFQDNPALSYLILTYSEMLYSVKDPIRAGKILNQLINISGSLVYNDANVALAAANYYSFFEKPHAALNVLESYLTINRPTSRLYSKYLSLLLDVGNYKDSQKAFEVISKQEIKDVDVLEVFIKYLLLYERQQEAIDLLNKHSDKFKENMKFYSISGNVFLKAQNFEKLKIVAQILVKKLGGSSPVLFANALKFAGYIKIAQNKLKEGESLFIKSIKVHESKELKEVLGKLYSPNSNINNDIIINSKIEQLINKSKKEASAQNWEKSFLYALEASDIDQNSLNAKLYLASLQSRRGYFNYAIETLDRLKNKYPQDFKVAYELVMANIRAYKLTDAKMHIVNYSSNIDFKSSYEYLALLGHYYSLVGNYKMAFDRFQGALQKNPLRDEIYFEMAKIAFSVKKFDKCKEYLVEAIKLDPFNYFYKILYSKVLYELDNVATAIGYIRNELQKTPDNSQLLGQIAIYYFRDQNYSEYKIYKEKLSRLTKSDESLYEYLLEAAVLENNKEDIINNGDQLLLLAPGKLEVRMKVAQAYTDLGQYQNAINMLNSIEERLNSYPRVNYNKAKIYLLINNYNAALQSGLKEIDISGSSELGYYITGEANIKLEKYDDAKKNLEKAIQIKPDSYDTLLALGWLKSKQGQFAAARELYLRAMRENEMDPELHKRLGYVYKEIGQGQMAIEQFKIYLKLNPASKDRNIINNIINQLQ